VSEGRHTTYAHGCVDNTTTPMTRVTGSVRVPMTRGREESRATARPLPCSRASFVALNELYGTARFNSTSISLSTRAFIDERQAQAVLGTEASVSRLPGGRVGPLAPAQVPARVRGLVMRYWRLGEHPWRASISTVSSHMLNGVSTSACRTNYCDCNGAVRTWTGRGSWDRSTSSASGGSGLE
jgi:hypothetical protein